MCVSTSELISGADEVVEVRTQSSNSSLGPADIELVLTVENPRYLRSLHPTGGNAAVEDVAAWVRTMPSAGLP